MPFNPYVKIHFYYAFWPQRFASGKTINRKVFLNGKHASTQNVHLKDQLES